jgi:hypothetical protein
MCLFMLCVEVTLLGLRAADILKAISQIEMYGIDYNDNDDDDDDNNNNNNSIQYFTPYSDYQPLLFCKYKRRL